MKTLFYISIFLLAISITANAQLKPKDTRWRNIFLARMHQLQNQKSSAEDFRLKINPYWENIDAPHLGNSYEPQVKVPTFNSVWARVNFDSVLYDANQFLRTADGGKTWLLDSIDAPAGYNLTSLAPTDGNVCYASLNNTLTNPSGKIFKTIDGGFTWNQLHPNNKFFGDDSYIDFLNFFDAKNGLAVGDGHGTDSTYLEIYTTCDAGKTWLRVPHQNLPPTIGRAFSFNFQVYAVFKNTIWFRAYDDQNNSYLYRSDDFGHTWQLFNSSSEYIDFAFADYKNGIANGFDENGNFYISVTHDGGKTFNKISYTGDPSFFIAAIPGSHTFVTSFPATSYSNDYGATWKYIDSGVTDHTDIVFLNPFVGWTGQGFDPNSTGGMYKWKYHFSLDNDAEPAVTKNIITGLSVNPNPVLNNTTISFNLQQAQKVFISIYDANGRLIKILANEQMQTGIHQLSWNARDERGIAAGAGIYSLKLQAGNYMETKKISVVH